MAKKLVYGVGINDADYTVCPTVNGKQVMCPFYRAWTNMLKRCYCTKYQASRQTYVGCTVCDEWLTFSSFKAWMETQDWKGKELDKDLLVKGNKVYSPAACAFVDSMTNTFTIDKGAARGEWPIGVYLNKEREKLLAQCCNPFTRKQESIGYFTCPEKANQAWKKRKHELALQLADLQKDSRVAEALRSMYL